MRVIGRIRALYILGGTFYFHTVPQSDMIQGSLERNPQGEYGRQEQNNSFFFSFLFFSFSKVTFNRTWRLKIVFSD